MASPGRKSRITAPSLRIRLAIAMFCLSLCQFLAIQPAAAAAGTGDCRDPHCYGGVVSNTAVSASNWRGVHAAMQLNWMVSGYSDSSTQYHINSTVFAGLKDSSNNYIEAGIANGYAMPNGFSGCYADGCHNWTYDSGSGGSAACYRSGCNAYWLYWADHNRSGGHNNEYMHVVRFTSPNPPAVLYIDVYNAGSGQWFINFSGAYNYHGVSTIESAYAKLQSYELLGEYYGPRNNGQCANKNQMSLAFWDQNLGLHPANTQNGPRIQIDPGFQVETGPNGYLGWSMPC